MLGVRAFIEKFKVRRARTVQRKLSPHSTVMPSLVALVQMPLSFRLFSAFMAS